MAYPKTIYKYRDWKDLNHKKILTDQQIYFASPNQFNDPFDCRITDNLSLISPDEITEFINTKVAVAIRNGIFDESQRQFKTNYLINKFRDLPKMQAEQEKITFETQDDCYGIFSGSSRWDSILMWSHYANKHTGFCVGFKEIVLRNYLFSLGHIIKGGQISYSEDYPQMKPIADFTPNDSLMKAFTQTHTKSKEWFYEDECRIVKAFETKLTLEQRQINIPIECFEEIILGISIDEPDQNEIIAFCNKNNILVYKAEKVPFKFLIRKKLIK
ncbi:MAG: DUF2971 domain-containing protein [Bacteroidetes bacterium]|nr:DUF2971 domain-containing protein [Bacteroidota bacterium]